MSFAHKYLVSDHEIKLGNEEFKPIVFSIIFSISLLLSSVCVVPSHEIYFNYLEIVE